MTQTTKEAEQTIFNLINCYAECVRRLSLKETDADRKPSVDFINECRGALRVLVSGREIQNV